MKRFLLFCLLSSSFLSVLATVSKMNSVTISTSTNIVGAPRASVDGVAIAGGGGGGTEFVTGTTLTTLRNDFVGDVGMKITVGGAGITVTHLGRWVVAGNSGTHTVYLCSDTGFGILGSVSVNTSGATTAAFAYTALGSPITLTASGVYYIVSHETLAGDQWYETTTTVTTTAVATVNDSCYGTAGAALAIVGSGSGHTFVPVSFKY